MRSGTAAPLVSFGSLALLYLTAVVRREASCCRVEVKCLDHQVSRCHSARDALDLAVSDMQTRGRRVGCVAVSLRCQDHSRRYIVPKCQLVFGADLSCMSGPVAVATLTHPRAQRSDAVAR